MGWFARYSLRIQKRVFGVMSKKNRKWLGMLGIAILIYVLFVGIIYVKQRSFMYFPFTDERPNISAAPWMSIVQVKTSDGLGLVGWFQQASETDLPTIVFFHGNGHNISVRVPKANVFVEKHIGILLAEYRGYGGNPGSPSKDGLFKDGRAYMEWLIKEQGIPAENIILYGESLGTAVALKMATEYNVKAIILETPFNRIVDVAQAQFFFIPFLKHLMKDDFDNGVEIQKLENTPILFGLAGQDFVIPARFGKSLFDISPEPKTLVKLHKAGHNNMYEFGFGDRVLEFIESLDAKEQNKQMQDE